MEDLNEEELKILLAVERMNNSECDFPTLVRTLNLTETKTEYYLYKLSFDRNYLYWIGSVHPDVPDRYRLTRKGRKFLVQGSYVWDIRETQEIADTWPRTIDDSASRKEWGWNPDFDLESMTVDMLETIKKRFERGELWKFNDLIGKVNIHKNSEYSYIWKVKIISEMD